MMSPFTPADKHRRAECRVLSLRWQPICGGVTHHQLVQQLISAGRPDGGGLRQPSRCDRLVG
jgi:hypothetical protein